MSLAENKLAQLFPFLDAISYEQVAKGPWIVLTVVFEFERYDLFDLKNKAKKTKSLLLITLCTEPPLANETRGVIIFHFLFLLILTFSLFSDYKLI